MSRLVPLVLLFVICAAPSASAKKGKTFPIVKVSDCGPICERMMECRFGPWDSYEICKENCEHAPDSAETRKTYGCVAKATTCDVVRKCEP